jgi:hypothetical protein
MGLFDNLINNKGIKEGFSQIGKGLEQAVNEVGKEIDKSGLKDDFKKIGEDLGSSSKTPKSVPQEYLTFPQFEGTIAELSTKKIDKYHRCTIDYKDVTEDQVNAYISKIEEVGFKKGSDVRYDRDNTYIILEKDIPSLHLVFHVKH